MKAEGDPVRIATWNMAWWSHRRHHEAAWRWVFDVLQPDVFLCQECVPPEWVREGRTVLWHRAYPESARQPWGTGVITKYPCTPSRVTGVDQWFDTIPEKVPGEEKPAGIHRADGWLTAATVKLPGLGDTLVGSVHNPAYPIEKSRIEGIDVSAMKLKKNPDLWFLDVLSFFLRPLLGQQLLFGGDFNTSRLLDKTLGERGNNEFFDRIHEEGFVSLHRLFNDADERTFFQKAKAHHQLDYLYGDAPVSGLARACKVYPYEEVAEFSDHAALVADLDVAGPDKDAVRT